MPRHCVSIKPYAEYRQILNIISEEDPSCQAVDLDLPVEDCGEPYQLLTLETDGEISEETEQAVDQLEIVVVSTFNIVR